MAVEVREIFLRQSEFARVAIEDFGGAREAAQSCHSRGLNQSPMGWREV